MILTFSENAWEDYLYWQKVDKKIVKKINGLIKEIQRSVGVKLPKSEADKIIRLKLKELMEKCNGV